jgi:hypothetical protein
MLFVTYWELSEDMDVGARAALAQKLATGGLFPPAGVTVLRWDATPDGWGILVVEAETAAQVNDAIMVWRAAGKGFFKHTRTAPALPVQEAIGASLQLANKLARG